MSFVSFCTNSQLSGIVKNMATVDAHGCILYSLHWRLPFRHNALWRRIYIHGVGFCVARSTIPGNAKASECGTGDGQSSHAFAYIYANTLIYQPALTWEQWAQN